MGQVKEKRQDSVQMAPGALIPSRRITPLSSVLLVTLRIGSSGYVKFKMLGDS